MRYIALFAFLLLFLTFSFRTVSAGDPKPEEILAKHYSSIGPAEKLQSLKTLFAGGASSFEVKNPIVRGGGKAVVVSDPNNLFFLMSLNSREYPFEKIGMFGNKVDLPFISSGTRSLLGTFLAEHSRVLSDNLFCGAMSLRWINNFAAGTKLKLSSTGSKKINNRKAYGIEVLLGTSSGEFSVRLFFDAENFHHLRSEYKRDIPIRSVTFGRQNELANSHIELTEEFSDFKDMDGLMLPYDYRVTFVSNSGDQTYSNSWEIKVINYLLNQKLEPGFFSFDTK